MKTNNTSTVFGGISNDELIERKARYIAEKGNIDQDTALKIADGSLRTSRGITAENYLMLKYTGNERLVVIPEELSHIGRCAFSGCSSLETVVFMGAVSIGVYAFRNCRSLKRIVAPAGISYIGAGAFEGCGNLEETDLGDRDKLIAFGIGADEYIMKTNCSTKHIGDLAFFGCKSLRKVVLGSDIGMIGEQAFGQCPGIEELVVGGKTEKVGKQVFADCTGLTINVTDESGEEVLSGMFEDCQKLKASQ